MTEIQNSKYNPEATAETRKRYQRNARFYDWMGSINEKRHNLWREKLWAPVKGPNVLEIGVGTGKNMPYYPGGVEITAIDITPGMLDRAKKRSARLGSPVKLLLGDVQRLEFQDNTFDSAVASCVFCSVPDPILGLKEIWRVLKPGGSLYLMEHMRSEQEVLGKLMDWLNPLVVKLMGANINRRTLENIRLAGFEISELENLGYGGIFKRITARKL